MNLLKNIKVLCALGSVSLFLSACATADFPEIVEDNQANVSGEITEQESDVVAGNRKIKFMPKEGKSLKADVKNVAYDDEEEIDDTLNVADLVTASKTTPVLVENMEEENVSVEEKDALVHDEVVTADASPSVTYRLETFYFDNGSSNLGGSYRGQINEIVKMVKNKNAKVKILGYASSRTRNTDVVSHKLANFNVSLERAQAVAKALKKAGLSVEEIEVEALSDSAPAYVEVMPEGERLNRRAEVYISY